MVRQFVKDLAALAASLAKFVFKMTVVVIIVLGIPAMILSFCDWVLRFWGLEVTP